MPNISSSEDVIKYSVEAVKALENPGLQVYNMLKQSIPDADSKEILESWRESLGIMIAIADNREECKWFAPLYPIDKAFTKNPIYVSGKTAENLERLFSNVSNTD
ncbi:MAG: hypothetical protein GY795_14440 [Desulfobacterales bacterium]|nr:hypothetical protein [Desulfobacterales bacterium]